MLAVLLSVCMLAGMVVCPANVQVKAEDYTEDVVEPLGDELTYGDFSYTVKEDGTVEITGYDGTETDVEIPSEIDGMSVTGIGASAFFGSNIQKVIMPDTITYIEYQAFFMCRNLEKITLSANLIKIGQNAFMYCENLKEIDIPDSVENILDSAFYDCRNLTSVIIPANLKYISQGIFGMCTNLNEIVVDENNTAVISENGILYNKSKTQLLRYPAGKTGEVVISSTVRDIEANAFSGLKDIKCVVIPDNVIRIHGSAFSECDNLESVVVSENATTIAESAFKGCEKMISISISSAVTSIGGYAFSGCENLKDVYFNGTEEQWKKIDIKSDNECLLNATIHYQPNTQTTPDNEITNNTGNIQNSDTQNEKQTVSLNSVIVSKSDITYTGKPQTPSITVTDTNGQPVDASNYTVTYANNKNVGQATVTVTGTGNYTGTVTAHFTIIPKGTTLSKITAKKKAFAVKWKKQTKQVTGYELQYSTSKKFKGAKSVTIKKNKTTSSTVKKLKAKKKYFVRIRTYKTVKIDGKSKKLYSAWSKAKTVKTKK